MREGACTVGGHEKLKDCKRKLESIRRLNRELEALRLPETGIIPKETISRKEKELREARFGYIKAMSTGIEAMAGMPESSRAVLWRAYMLGMSNTQIAEGLHYARRSVLRLKRAGLEWMEENHERVPGA